MTRGQVLYLHLCVFITTATGLIFAVMKYFLRPVDEFSVINHPLQPHLLSAHVVVAPALLFGLGWVFGDHIWPNFRSGDRRNRASGLWSMAAIIPMTLSAYLLQVSTGETLRKVMAGAHWLTSALFVVTYIAHLVKRPAPANGRSTDAAGGVNAPSPG